MMGESNVTSTVKSAELQSAKKVGFFKGIRMEFQKIIWPNRDTTVKSTYTVVVVALVIGLFIAGIDAGFRYLIYDLILGNL